MTTTIREPLDRLGARALERLDDYTWRMCLAANDDSGRRRIAAEVIAAVADDLRREGAAAALQQIADTAGVPHDGGEASLFVARAGDGDAVWYATDSEPLLVMRDPHPAGPGRVALWRHLLATLRRLPDTATLPAEEVR